MTKYIALSLLLVGCATSNHEYQVHLKEGDGTMHLYTGADKADALEYIKFYEKSHGDMKLIKFKK
tara:strand:+ start:389 stop:583 length:195 start_codon:yes stop_codon:yes gene_type:complete